IGSVRTANATNAMAKSATSQRDLMAETLPAERDPPHAGPEEPPPAARAAAGEPDAHRRRAPPKPLRDRRAHPHRRMRARKPRWPAAPGTVPPKPDPALA